MENWELFSLVLLCVFYIYSIIYWLCINFDKYVKYLCMYVCLEDESFAESKAS